jgi:hypothetical protein
VAELQESLAKEFANQLHEYFVDREKLANDTVGFIIEKVERASPEIRMQVIEKIVALGRSSGLVSARLLLSIEEGIPVQNLARRNDVQRKLVEVMLAMVLGTGSNFAYELIRIMIGLR